MKNSITKFTKHTGKNIAKFAKKNPTAVTITVGGIGISCCGLITGLIRTSNCKKKLKKLVHDLSEENKNLSEENDKLFNDYNNLSEENKNLSEENDELSDSYTNLFNKWNSLSDDYKALKENAKTHEEEQV